MTISLVLLYFFGLISIFFITRNLFDFRIIYGVFVFPAALSAQYEIALLFSLSIFCLSIGSIIGNFFLKKDTSISIQIFKSSEINLGFKNPKFFFLTWVFLTIFCIMLSIFYFYQVGISLFAEEVGIARLENRHIVTGSYFYQRLFRVFLPILCMVYFLMGFCKETKNYYSTSIFLILSLITLLLLVFTGMRGNVLTFYFFPFIVLLGLITGSYLNFRLIFSFLSIAIFGFLATAYMYQTYNIYEIFLVLVQRISIQATDGITQSFYFDVPQNGFYYGRTFLEDLLSFGTKLGLTIQENFTYSAQIAMQILGPKYRGEQAAIYFFGEFYANFGFVGVVFFSLLLGVFLQIISIKTMKTNKTLLRVAALSYFQAVLIMILGGPLVSMFVDYFVTVSLFFFIFVLGCSIPTLKVKK